MTISAAALTGVASAALAEVMGKQRQEPQLAPGRVVTWYHPVAQGALQLKIGQFEPPVGTTAVVGTVVDVAIR